MHPIRSVAAHLIWKEQELASFGIEFRGPREVSSEFERGRIKIVILVRKHLSNSVFFHLSFISFREILTKINYKNSSYMQNHVWIQDQKFSIIKDDAFPFYLYSRGSWTSSFCTKYALQARIAPTKRLWMSKETDAMNAINNRNNASFKSRFGVKRRHATASNVLHIKNSNCESLL